MKWNSRKLALAAAVIALAIVLLVFGQISSDQAVDLIKWTVGPYLVAQSVVDRGSQ